MALVTAGTHQVLESPGDFGQQRDSKPSGARCASTRGSWPWSGLSEGPGTVVRGLLQVGLKVAGPGKEKNGGKCPGGRKSLAWESRFPGSGVQEGR